MRAACILALALFASPAMAKGWDAIRTLGEITVCANPNALPYASEKDETPGFQIEIARAIAQRLGVRLRPQWIVPRVRAGLVDCDLLMDTILVPGVQPPSLKVSVPYYRSGVALASTNGPGNVTGFSTSGCATSSK